MQHKKRLQLLLAGAVLLLAVWFYFSGKPFFSDKSSSGQSAPTTPSTDVTKQPHQTIGFDYDFVMKNDPIGPNKQAPTDYYMLVLSWSPAFCATQRERHGNTLPPAARYQCEVDRRFGWIIHGLWPQNAQARHVSEHPRFCRGDLPMVDKGLISQYLAESPGAALLQGEWEKHGACAFEDAQAYFEKQRSLFRSLTLPDQALSKTELFRWLKKNNPQLKNAYLNASRNELFICYDLAFRVTDCPRNNGY